MQHRPDCGATEDRGLLCETQHPVPGVEEENSVAGGSHSLTGQEPTSMGSSTDWLWSAKICFLKVCPVQSRFLAGYKGEACKDNGTRLPLDDTNQPRTAVPILPC